MQQSFRQTSLILPVSQTLLQRGTATIGKHTGLSVPVRFLTLKSLSPLEPKMGHCIKEHARTTLRLLLQHDPSDAFSFTSTLAM